MATRPRLLLLGSGGLARETAEAVVTLNGRTPTWDLLGFLDDDPQLEGTTVGGLPVLGAIEAAELARHAGAATVAPIARPGDATSRARVVERVTAWRSCGGTWATIVHPDCHLAGSTIIGEGSVLLAGVVATASVEVGCHVMVMPGVILTHENTVADYVTIASGVRFGGGVRVGRAAYVGAGALIKEGVSVGAGALIGLGAVVLGDVPPGEVWAGNPARRLR